MQGTSTSITDVLIYGAAAANGSTSPLMSTKAQFDLATLPWVRQNALKTLTAQQNNILMNDFIDGATTHTAYELSKARFAGQTAAETTAITARSATEARAVQGQLTRAQEDLKNVQEREALLQSLVSKETVTLDATGSVSGEERSTLGVLQEAHKESRDITKAQKAVLNLAKQRAAAVETSSSPNVNAAPAKDLAESKSPGEQLVSAQTDLEKNRSKETLLQSIVAKHTAELNAKESVADKERSVLGILRATQKEAEETRKAQEEVLNLAKKRVSESK